MTPGLEIALTRLDTAVARLSAAVDRLDRRVQLLEVECGVVCEACGGPLTDAEEDHLLHLCPSCRGVR